MSRKRKYPLSNNDPRVLKEAQQDFDRFVKKCKPSKRRRGGCCLFSFALIIAIPSGITIGIIELVKNLVA